jgi:hypothetical protein
VQDIARWRNQGKTKRNEKKKKKPRIPTKPKTQTSKSFPTPFGYRQPEICKYFTMSINRVRILPTVSRVPGRREGWVAREGKLEMGRICEQASLQLKTRSTPPRILPTCMGKNCREGKGIFEEGVGSFPVFLPNTITDQAFFFFGFRTRHIS